MKYEKTSGTYRLEDIVMEVGEYWVLRVPKGFEIYRIGITHSTRCAQIGFEGERGLSKVREEIERRIALDLTRSTQLQRRQRAQPAPEIAAPSASTRERARG